MTGARTTDAHDLRQKRAPDLGELLFQVLTEREAKASVAVASDAAFSGWIKRFAGLGFRTLHLRRGDH